MVLQTIQFRMTTHGGTQGEQPLAVELVLNWVLEDQQGKAF